MKKWFHSNKFKLHSKNYQIKTDNYNCKIYFSLKEMTSVAF